MTSSLQTTIESLYHAFSDVPRPTSIDGCSCCVDDKEISILLSKPLRHLTPDDLTHYASSAFLTVGAVEDFLYFLPRILEILATKRDWWPDPEVVTRAIASADFHTWPDPRKNVLHQYFHAIFDDLLATESSGFEIDSWICALGRLHLPLAPFLDRIAAVPARLLEFYEVNRESLPDNRLSNAFWDDAPQEHNEVVTWFQSPKIRGVIDDRAIKRFIAAQSVDLDE